MQGKDSQGIVFRYKGTNRGCRAQLMGLLLVNLMLRKYCRREVKFEVVTVGTFILAKLYPVGLGRDRNCRHVIRLQHMLQNTRQGK